MFWTVRYAVMYVSCVHLVQQSHQTTVWHQYLEIYIKVHLVTQMAQM